MHLQTGGAKAEEDQLGHLANLYSLRVRRDAPGSFSAFKTGSVQVARSAGSPRTGPGGIRDRSTGQNGPSQISQTFPGETRLFPGTHPIFQWIPRTISCCPTTACGSEHGNKPQS